MNTQQILMGKIPAKATMVEVRSEDAFKDTPIFGFGVEETDENPFLKNWPEGGTLVGRVEDLRETKVPQGSKEKPRAYACLVTADGEKFRAYTPGQLRYSLEQAGKENLLSITYLGKEEVEGYPQALHQFNVQKIIVQ